MTDWLTSFGGAERVLHELHQMYPAAPIYASVVDRSALPELTRDWDVRTTGLQRFPMARLYSRALLPLMPAAFSRLDLSAFDVVITSSSAFSKNVTVPEGAVNVCYCYTPPRYLWALRESYAPGLLGRVSTPVLAWLRAQDLSAATRVHRFLAISRVVAERIRDTYGRTAELLHPPVDVKRLVPTGMPPDDFYLVVSRLVRYKRVDLAVDACNRLGRRLVIVGDGPERRRLRAMAGPTVEFRGFLDDRAVANLYARCRGFLFPGFEDFGIAPVEAQAAGRPVIALRAGGALETVVDGVTGVFFEEQSVAAMVGAIERAEQLALDPAACRANAERFDASLFRERMAAVIATSAR